MLSSFLPYENEHRRTGRVDIANTPLRCHQTSSASASVGKQSLLHGKTGRLCPRVSLSFPDYPLFWLVPAQVGAGYTVGSGEEHRGESLAKKQ